MLVDSPLETPTPLQSLATASARLYPKFTRELEVESGTKVDLRDYGTILFPTKHHISHPQLRSAGVGAIDPEVDEPALGTPAFEDELEMRASMHEKDFDTSSDVLAEAVRFPLQNLFYLRERSVDPRALSAAAFKTAKNHGVDFSSGDAATSVDVSGGRVTGVLTAKTSFVGSKVVNCAGCWSGQLSPSRLPTRPVKGQMLCLVMQPRNLLKHVIRTPEVYLIPRSDGRLLVGATVEEAGFNKRTDPSTIQRLHRDALKLVPKLADAKILEDWAGLRPGTPDNLPILGATEIPGYYVATGHFRDGILLAPITANVMADVIEGRKPEHDLTPFSPQRF
jgi:glycine/D-amino acid oxidase-like deaminating enzyme